MGATDADVFENNLLEVMQFIFNHTTFHADDPVDAGLLAAYKPLGIEPGKSFDPSRVPEIDGKRFGDVSVKIKETEFARTQDPVFTQANAEKLFRTKGQISDELLLFQSVLGPIGLPASEAMYIPVVAADGAPLNAENDYVVHMSKDALPPAGAFWSLTLYDKKNGFFIPNDRKKYSVGENGGMKLRKDGGIDIYIAAAPIKKVPEENRLPITRKNEDMDIVLRIYVPDVEKMKTWKPPVAEILK